MLRLEFFRSLIALAVGGKGLKAVAPAIGVAPPAAELGPLRQIIADHRGLCDNPAYFVCSRSTAEGLGRELGVWTPSHEHSGWLPRSFWVDDLLWLQDEAYPFCKYGAIKIRSLRYLCPRCKDTGEVVMTRDLDSYLYDPTDTPVPCPDCSSPIGAAIIAMIDDNPSGYPR